MEIVSGDVNFRKGRLLKSSNIETDEVNERK